MLPGMKGAQAQMSKAGVDEKTLGRMEAMILSMTPRERAKPDLLNAKRKIRIAKGSGVTVQEVNKLIKMHQEMEGAMKRIRKMGGLEKFAAMLGGGMPGMANMPGMPKAPGGFPFKR
jgi:signal recognition particle subunit SRP54